MGESFPRETAAAEKLRTAARLSMEECCSTERKNAASHHSSDFSARCKHECERRDSSWPGDCRRHDNGSKTPELLLATPTVKNRCILVLRQSRHQALRYTRTSMPEVEVYRYASQNHRRPNCRIFQVGRKRIHEQNRRREMKVSGTTG